METSQQKSAIPHKMSEYIRNYFKSEFLTDVKTTIDRRGNLVYLAEISHDNTLYHMKFDAKGNLLHHGAEPLQEMYDEEGFYPGMDD